MPLTGLRKTFKTICADPPWRFKNRTGRVAPEYKRLKRYETMSVEEICELPVIQHAEPDSHLYLWIPNALISEGLQVMQAWGFTYKTNLVWVKIDSDSYVDLSGVGSYYRNATELLLMGVRGSLKTLPPARSLSNVICAKRQEHSRKPQEAYNHIEKASPGPYLELFARGKRKNWRVWGDEAG